MTFADLMSLLMCFFVLMLAFSEMDVLKFKQLAGSMKEAFGVQREIKAREIPKGTNIIAREFSPGRPNPTPLPEVRQHSADDWREFLEVQSPAEAPDPVEEQPQVEIKEVPVEFEADATKIIEAFKGEIADGLIDVETEDERIIIRIQEKGSFPSGRAVLKGGFEPVMDRISNVLFDTPGQIVIAGHTDNVPISTTRFRSNWELSAARAVTVLHYILSTHEFDQERFLVEGHADSRPLEPNDSAENRARNRRVELVIVQAPNVEPEHLDAYSEINETPGDTSETPVHEPEEQSGM